MGKYEIKNENGGKIDGNLLQRYFGNFWQTVLDRLNHDCDGYLLTIHHQDYEFRVYRVLDR